MFERREVCAVKMWLRSPVSATFAAVQLRTEGQRLSKMKSLVGKRKKETTIHKLRLSSVVRKVRNPLNAAASAEITD